MIRPKLGENTGFLTADEAIRILLDRDPEGVTLDPVKEFAVVAGVGRPDANAWVAPARELVRMDFGPPLHALVIPAPELHFAEDEALSRYRRPKPLR